MNDHYNVDQRRLYVEAYLDELYARAAEARLAGQAFRTAPHPLRRWLGNRLISAGEALKGTKRVPVPADPYTIGPC